MPAVQLEARIEALLGPTVNIHRSPLAGRNFECYSEDPYLSAEIAHALISRVQSHGIACCVKHFACNDSEFERTTISSDVDERTLDDRRCRAVPRAPIEDRQCQRNLRAGTAPQCARSLVRARRRAPQPPLSQCCRIGCDGRSGGCVASARVY